MHRYHLTTPDMGTNLLADVMAGFTPHSLPVLLVCLVSPIIVLLTWVLGKQADAVARKYNKAAVETTVKKVKSGKGG